VDSLCLLGKPVALSHLICIRSGEELHKSVVACSRFAGAVYEQLHPVVSEHVGLDCSLNLLRCCDRGSMYGVGQIRTRTLGSFLAITPYMHTG